MSKTNREPKFYSEQRVIVKANSTVIYTHTEYLEEKSNHSHLAGLKDLTTSENSPAREISNKTNGFISERAQSRLKNYIKIIFWLTNCFRKENGKVVLRASNKITFLTLTLCFEQFHDDIYIKDKMLQQFFTELNLRYPGLLYIWRAEKQLNGNIHFHIILNKYIPHERARAIWIRQLSKLGYLQKYQHKMSKLSFPEYLLLIRDSVPDKIPKYKRSFLKQQSENWSNPPCTHIVGLKSVKYIYSYISKYISKNPDDSKNYSHEQIEKLKILGHTFFICQGLSAIKYNNHSISAKLYDELEHLQLNQPDSVHSSDYFIVIAISAEKLYNLNYFHLFNLFKNSLPPSSTLFINQ